MSLEEQYARATSQAEQRRAVFLSSAATAKARISPARLKQDVKNKAQNGLRDGSAKAKATVQEHPFAVGAAATALTLYFFRRPVSALLRRVYVRLTNRKPELSETDDG